METAFLWVLHLGRVCLWGSLLIAAAGLLCRMLPRLPSALRAWLWWLVCLKLVFDLCLTAPIALPILPAPVVAAQPTTQPAKFSAVPRLPSKAVVSVGKAVLPTEGESAASGPAPQAQRWPLFLFAAWSVGVFTSLTVIACQGFALRRLRRGTFSLTLTGIDTGELASGLGLHHTPRILSGLQVTTPCVAGWRHPAILLPPDLGETLSETEMRLTLAHEMAHLKRGDLRLAFVPAVARTLFFFHPLVWWAASEWAAAREEACDALALSATKLSRADYGRLLLKLASPAASAPALGLSPGYHTLRRRLTGLTHTQTPQTRCMRLLILMLPVLLPWRLTAAVPAAERQHAVSQTASYAIDALASDSDVSALNDAGQVTLTQHRSSGDSRSYAGTSDSFDPLGALPKHHASIAYGMNGSGQAVGTSFNIPGHGRAFFWDGTPHRLGSLPGYPYSEARGVNDAGLVAGFSETGSHDRFRAWITRAFLAQNGTLLNLGTLGGSYSAAYGISAAGVVVGKADTEAFGVTHAFAWADGRMTDLGTLGGTNSVAYAANAQGQIVGASEIDGSQSRHAFLSEGGRMRDLGTLPGLNDSTAYAVNSSTLVVGVSQNAGSGSAKCATLWQNGLPTDLNAHLPPHSPWLLTEARAVNSYGQIAGQGLFYGKPRAFLLTPR